MFEMINNVMIIGVSIVGVTLSFVVVDSIIHPVASMIKDAAKYLVEKIIDYAEGREQWFKKVR